MDEAGGLLVAPVNQLAMVVTLVPRDSLHAVRAAHPDAEVNDMSGTPFGMMRETLLGPDHVPCNPPPWGELVAFDLARGTTRWRIPLGNVTGLEGRGYGSPELGGVLLTRGGLAFVAGTLDHHFRAIDLATGRERWSAALPVGGHALPMTYMAGGRQYIVIAAGGHDRLTIGPPALGDYVLAYTLDEPGRPRRIRSSHPLTGAWVGDFLIADHERFPTAFDLVAQGDSLVGRPSTAGGRIPGPLVIHRKGTRVSLRLAFEHPARALWRRDDGRGRRSERRYPPGGDDSRCARAAATTRCPGPFRSAARSGRFAGCRASRTGRGTRGCRRWCSSRWWRTRSSTAIRGPALRRASRYGRAGTTDACCSRWRTTDPVSRAG